MTVTVSTAAELVADGIPAAVFAGFTVAGHRMSPTAKLHRETRCYHLKSDTWKLREVTVPLVELKARAVCTCWSYASVPAAVATVVEAASAVHAVLRAAEGVQAALAGGQPPALDLTAAVTAAATDHLVGPLTALLASPAGAAGTGRQAAVRALHASAVAAATTARDAVAALYGADPQREIRHAAASLRRPLEDHFRSGRHPALTVIGHSPQKELLEQADQELDRHLRAGTARPQLIADVLAVVHDAQPVTLSQVPDEPVEPGVGARTGALRAWRAAARAELTRMLAKALCEVDELTRDDAPTLVLVGGDLDETSSGLLGRAELLGVHEGWRALAAPAVVARAASRTWSVEEYGPLPAGAAERGRYVHAVLRLLDQDLDGDAIVLAAAGIAAAGTTTRRVLASR